jgi:hypothetical protein
LLSEPLPLVIMAVVSGVGIGIVMAFDFRKSIDN